MTISLLVHFLKVLVDFHHHVEIELRFSDIFNGLDFPSPTAMSLKRRFGRTTAGYREF